MQRLQQEHHLAFAELIRIESHPSIELEDLIGTPITGNVVMLAIIPGKCAAPPAPAIITFNPRSAALVAYSTMRIGVRCADTIVNSKGISNSFNNFSSILHNFQIAIAAHDNADDR